MTLYSISEQSIIKEIPIIANLNNDTHVYQPVSVQLGKELIMVNMILLQQENSRDRRLVSRIVALQI